MITFLRHPSALCMNYNVVRQQVRNDILDQIIAAESHFVPASVSTSVSSARKARVLYRTGLIAASEEIYDLVRDLAPDIYKAFGYSDAPPAQIEKQITAHGHGDYFRVHNDDGTPDSDNRRISFVYYVHTGGFVGGQLRIYDTREDKSLGLPLFDVHPVDNSILFFTSSTWHEVLPIYLGHGNLWQNHRFTVNGWMRK